MNVKKMIGGLLVVSSMLLGGAAMAQPIPTDTDPIGVKLTVEQFANVYFSNAEGTLTATDPMAQTIPASQFANNGKGSATYNGFVSYRANDNGTITFAWVGDKAPTTNGTWTVPDPIAIDNTDGHFSGVSPITFGVSGVDLDLQAGNYQGTLNATIQLDSLSVGQTL